MEKKNFLQYSLLFTFAVSFLFYNKYFANNVEITKNKKEDILEKNNFDIIQNDTSKNIIENLKYVSEDLLGNTYTVTAQSATLKEDKVNEVQLFEVNAEIVRKTKK